MLRQPELGGPEKSAAFMNAAVLVHPMEYAILADPLTRNRPFRTSCSARSFDPVDTLHCDQVILDHINNPEPAHAQTVILIPVKTLRRGGI